MTTKVALITGGASGMGLAVAKALSDTQEWDIHILDINEASGKQAVQDVPRTTFHRVDVTKYSDLNTAFQNTFQAHSRLDFVFANAGVVERKNFYAPLETNDKQDLAPPPEPDLELLNICLRGVIWTANLAQHYFRISPHQGQGASLVMTSSAAGLYAAAFSPIYVAAKFGVVGFMRSVAEVFITYGIRVNAICPGAVRTNFIDAAGWASFPQDPIMEVGRVSQLVMQLVNGGDPAGEGLTDVTGTHIPAAKLYGVVVELSKEGNYFRDQHAFCDDGMRAMLGGTSMENRNGILS